MDQGTQHKATKGDKEQQREERLLKLMGEHRCSIETCADAAAVILNFEGFRRVKCAVQTIQTWLAAGQIKVSVAGGKTIISLNHCYNAKGLDEVFASHAEKHREMHSGSILMEGEEHTVVRNINESPLARLYSSRANGGARWLESCEFSAGERFRSDFEYAQLGPRITASWDPTSQISSGKGGRRPTETLTDRAMGARVRFNKALDAVGPELSGVLMDICCFLKGLEQVEVERRWPRRSAKLILKIALSVLARHYEPPNARLGSAIKHWGTQDFRPTLNR